MTEDGNIVQGGELPIQGPLDKVVKDAKAAQQSAPPAKPQYGVDVSLAKFLGSAHQVKDGRNGSLNAYLSLGAVLRNKLVELGNGECLRPNPRPNAMAILLTSHRFDFGAHQSPGEVDLWELNTTLSSVYAAFR